MKVLVVGHFRADSTYAHAINTIKTAEGFVLAGHEVWFLCQAPLDRKFTPSNLQARFGLPPDLTILFDTHPRGLHPLASAAKRVIRSQSLTDDSSTTLKQVAVNFNPDFAYCRAFSEPVVLAEMGIPVVVESHASPDSASRSLVHLCEAFSRISQLRSLVTIHPLLMAAFEGRGVPGDRIALLPDGVDVEAFRRPADYLPAHNPQLEAVYTGSLESYKGIPTVLQAAALAHEVNFHLYGGQQRDQNHVRKQVRKRGLANVHIPGWIPHQHVPPVLWNADALLLVPSLADPSAKWTSPVKLGEYLASGTPTIASSIPALRFWLQDEVFWVSPDSPEELSRQLKELSRRTFDHEEVRARALARAESFSYTCRARRIVELAS